MSGSAASGGAQGVRMATPWGLSAVALCALAGMGSVQWLAQLPEPLYWWGLAALGMLALALARIGPFPLRWPLLCLAAVVLAASWAGLRAQQRWAQQLPAAWEGRDLWVTGRIDSLPQSQLGQGGVDGWRFAFVVDKIEDPEGTTLPAGLPQRLMLSVFAQPGRQAMPVWRPGERWRLLLRLRQVHGSMNPGGFDYELWLFEQGIRATGLLRRWQLLGEPQGLYGAVDRWRQGLRERLQTQLGPQSATGVLIALSLGEQAAISRSDWALFRDTGTSHLMAISGLHVTMFAWGAGLLGGWAWRRSGRLCLALPAPVFARWAGVLCALAYALFSGWGVPAQRTVWMLLVLALLRQAGLAWPWPLCLLAGALLVALIDPWALCQSGFWLSFAAVGLLMAGGVAEPGWRGLLRSAWRNQCIATLGLAPLTLLFFQQLSPVGLLANLLAIPWISLLVTPLALAGALLPPLWSLAAWLLQGLMFWLELLARLPGAVWSVPVAPFWAQLCGLLGAALLVLPWPWRLRPAGLALMLPLLWPALPRPALGQFELLAADVGQGTAVLLRTRHHALLYDTGPQYHPQADAGQRVLLPLLRALGQRELDLLLLSHRDQDHVGGAASLLAGLPVQALLSSLEPGHPLLQAAGAPRTAQQRCERGQRWHWDGVEFELLHPRPVDYERPGLKPNALSCVLLIRAADGRRALLTGDVEAAQEGGLRPPAGIDLLMLPHHGSQTSSSPALLAAASPRLAFVQAGYRNRFGHPAPAVLARYQAAGVPVIQSADCGALHWSSAAPAEARCERELRRRYWHRTSAAPAAAEPGPLPQGGEEPALR